jgi:hypothetical protein
MLEYPLASLPLGNQIFPIGWLQVASTHVILIFTFQKIFPIEISLTGAIIDKIVTITGLTDRAEPISVAIIYFALPNGTPQLVLGRHGASTGFAVEELVDL